VTDSQFTAAVLKGDSTGIAATYSDDAIFMPPNMKVARGRAAITSSFGGMIAVEKATAFSLSSQDLIVSGDYGIQTGSYDLTVQLKTGKSMHDVGKFLAVYQRQPDGSYKMIRDIFNSDSPPPK
jgi:ketosteroid isomerase-like protein